MKDRHGLPTIGGARREAVRVLREAGIDSAALDVDVLLSHVLGWDRSSLLSHGDQGLSPADAKAFRSFVSRRSRHEPVAHITGTKEFYGLEFAVNRHVLVPRPKTEEMVERAKAILSECNLAETLVIDVGTGSGILAITVKKLFPRVTVLAIDHSKRALKVAMGNARKHGYEVVGSGSWLLNLRHGVIHFLHSDLLTGVTGFPFRNVLVLANLPYVPTGEIMSLEPDVRDFDPTKALDGGGDGLGLFRRMAKQAKRKFGGKHVKVLWECDPEQEATVQAILAGLT